MGRFEKIVEARQRLCEQDQQNQKNQMVWGAQQTGGQQPPAQPTGTPTTPPAQPAATPPATPTAQPAATPPAAPPAQSTQPQVNPVYQDINTDSTKYPLYKTAVETGTVAPTIQKAWASLGPDAAKIASDGISQYYNEAKARGNV